MEKTLGARQARDRAGSGQAQATFRSGKTKLCKNQAPRLHAGRVAAALGFHLVVLLAPWTFTWAGLFTAVVLFTLTGQFGVGLGYHRLLCHRSFQTIPLLRYLFISLGVLALQEGPLTWCAIHRLHHRHSDQEADPQMAHRDFLWAHFLWTLVDQMAGLRSRANVERVTRDLQRQRVLRHLECHFYLINGVFAIGLFLAGSVVCGGGFGASLLVWGFFVRVVCGWHLTFLVNSINHRCGYRNYPTSDNSRNCWWVALLTFGEGWHNNHHYHPRSAAHGHRWFEIDTTYGLIRFLELLGLACEVIQPHMANRGLRQVFLRQEGSAH